VVQGSAADMMKRAMLRIRVALDAAIASKKLAVEDAFLVMQVHDEIGLCLRFFTLTPEKLTCATRSVALVSSSAVLEVRSAVLPLAAQLVQDSMQKVILEFHSRSTSNTGAASVICYR